MIEPLVRAPLAIPGAQGLGPGAARTGSVLALPSGEIAGDFRPLGVLSKRRIATYELLVANDTPLTVRAFTYAVEGRPNARLTWNSIVVPPRSAIAVTVEIKLPRGNFLPRVVAELHANETRLTLDAGLPLLPPRRNRLRAWAFVAGIGLLAVLGASLGHAWPHVVALAAPDTVRGGTPFSVAYALTDARDAEYVVESPDGLQIRRGPLQTSAGAFTLDLPAATVSNGYDIRVIAHGRFGTSSRSAHIVALPPPPLPTPAVAAKAPAARLGALKLVHDEVDGGQPIVVDYRTSETVGSVRLIDDRGTVRAEALLNHRGRSILVAPIVDADQDLRVVVSVERGAEHAEAAVPVRVLRAKPAPTTNPSDSLATGGVADGATPIAVDPTIEPGAPIVVRILRHEPALRVALVDAIGTELAAQNVPAGAPSVTLAVPAGNASAQLSVLASYANGFVQETVIRPVSVRAATTR